MRTANAIEQMIRMERDYIRADPDWYLALARPAVMKNARVVGSF
jgi:hypothetical protein